MKRPLRRITADEFARRLKAASDQEDKRYAFFLGAGCSVSSGIPASSTLVRERWLPRLRNLRSPQNGNLDDWAAEEFKGYDPENPAASYGVVMQELFLQPEERQREIESLCDGHFPGFGYATLARLITMEGGHFNVVLTTNFDDLVQDALYLFTQARPLVIHHESLAMFIRPTRTRPLVVKLHGDNRLSPLNTTEETERLKDDIQKQIKAVLHDRGIIFIGYGGYDVSIKMMLESMPDESLPLGIYWISSQEPQNILRTWLESRGAVWVEQGNFDQLMLLIKNEFALPDPDESPFKDVFKHYLETYKSLSNKIAMLPETAPDALALKEAAETFDTLYERLLTKLSKLNSEATSSTTEVQL